LVSVGDLLNVLTEALDGSFVLELTGLNLVVPTATLQLSGFQVSSRSIVLVDAQEGAYLNISYSDIAPFLPSGRVDYEYETVVEASVVHNSSSPHAV
jgi:hypothetical protein